jgi:hypothetical protein
MSNVAGKSPSTATFFITFLGYIAHPGKRCFTKFMKKNLRTGFYLNTVIWPWFNVR